MSREFSVIKCNTQLGHGWRFLGNCLDAIIDYRAANGIWKLSRNYDFLRDEEQKDQSSRVGAQKLRILFFRCDLR
jgi:hypothetical protein